MTSADRVLKSEHRQAIFDFQRKHGLAHGRADEARGFGDRLAPGAARNAMITRALKLDAERSWTRSEARPGRVL